MNRSTPLSADARRLLELGSDVEPPTAEQDERMARALAPLFRSGRPGPFTLEGAGAPTRASAPATGSPLGGAEQHSANWRGPSPAAAHEHERSGVRMRTTPRATIGRLEPRRWLEPLHGLRDAKLWLTLGALAATASASFWLGRLSTPAELEPAEFASAALVAPLDPHRAESVGAPPAPATPAFASASPAAALLAVSDGAVSDGAVSVGAVSVGAVSSLQPPALRPSSLPPSPLPAMSLTPSSLPPPAPDAASGARAASRTSLPRGDLRARRSLGLAAEIEQLARAEAALRQGRAAHALLLLERRSVQHLQEQAAALRAIAECELGVATAAGSARDVLERWPASAFQPRIARACQP